jgi:vitamin B12 transporter
MAGIPREAVFGPGHFSPSSDLLSQASLFSTVARAVGTQKGILVKIRILASPAGILLAGLCYAQEAPKAITPEVVVTATRLPQQPSQSAQPTTVITAEEIAQSGQQTLVEVLQSLGGVEIAGNGGFGQVSSVFIRGANGNHTLVLVDGIRLNSATAGTTAFENIPLNQIEKIEIVSGPLSGLYGSDAIGGVIQIFTKSVKYSPSKNITAGAGRYNARTMSGGINSVIKDTEFSLNFGYFETAGFDATKATIPFGQHNPDKDGYRNTNISGKVAHHLGDNDEVGIMLFQSEGNTHYDNGPTTDDVNHQTLSAYSLYSRNQISKDWQSLIRIGQGEDKSAVTGAFPGFFQTRQPQLTWQNDVKLGPGTAIAGVEYLAQHVTSDTAYTQTYRTIKSWFGGYSGHYGDHGWQANARQDSNSQFGNHTTGILGYAYRLTSALRLRASAGTAFKAPTFNDLYYPGFSNPNLQPERSRNKEAGLDYQVGDHRFRATYFINQITDLIVFDIATFVPRNLSQARIKGTEFSYQGDWGGLRANAHVTFQNPIDDATGQLLQRRAREHGTLSITKAVGPWSVGTEIVASGARFDSNTEDPATRMHGYGLVNLIASYKLSQEWLIRARWNNIFNRDYELAQFFNTPGSNLFVTLQYQPK